MASPTRRIDLYVRAFAPTRDEHAGIVARLDSLRAADLIGEYDVRTWPQKIRLSERSICLGVVELYEQFSEWAETHEASIHPPFDRYETGFGLLDETDEALVLPVICLTVWEDEDLVGVYPCTVGERRYAIADCLDALERDGEPPV